MKKVVTKIEEIPVKRFVGLAVVILLTGCGMSEGEKQQLASVTCNVISNTTDDDSATRLEELNSARGQLGESLYTGSDGGIRDSVRFGICENLVLNDPTYQSLITQKQEMVAAEEKRIAGIAAVTCAVIGETRKIESAVRVKEINAARVEIGGEPFVDGDEIIRESIKFGLCDELVRNDPKFPELLSQKQEEETVQRKARAELAAKIAKREREERDRERKEREEKYRVAADKWRSAMVSDLAGAELKLKSVLLSDSRRFTVAFTCDRIEGFRRELVIVFKNELGTARESDTQGDCEENGRTEVIFWDFISDELDWDALSGLSNDAGVVKYYGETVLTGFIEDIFVLVNGVNPDKISPSDRRERLDSKEYPPIGGSYYTLKDPIRINIRI